MSFAILSIHYHFFFKHLTVSVSTRGNLATLHQTKRRDLQLTISISEANWRWFSVPVQTINDGRIRVILSIWQALIKEKIWCFSCFTLIIASFTLSPSRAFYRQWNQIRRWRCDVCSDTNRLTHLPFFFYNSSGVKSKKGFNI